MSLAGDLDLVVGNDDGALNYIENTGTSMAPEFVFFDFFPESSYSYSYLYDDDYVDDDVATMPPSSYSNPFDGVDLSVAVGTRLSGQYSAPALADLDGDGTLRPRPSIDKL